MSVEHRGIPAAGIYGGTTDYGFTRTSEGDLPHLPVAVTSGALLAPVCLVSGLKGKYGAPVPQRNADGGLVYALPGGATVAVE